MTTTFTLVISLCVVVCCLLKLWARQTYSYWKTRGVPQFPTIFPVGNFWSLVRLQTSFTNVIDGFYNKVSGDFYGIYLFTKPIFIVKNLDLLHRILGPDFDYFTSHGINNNKEEDPISASLVGLDGDEWKMMRSMLTPAFSLGKLKQFTPQIIQCGKQLTDRMFEYTRNGKTLEIMNFAKQYTVNIVASVGFGIEIDENELDRDPFTIISEELVSLKKTGQARMMVNIFYRQLARTFKIHMISPLAEKLLYGIVNDIIDVRKKNNIQKVDFIQQLIALMSDGDKHNRPNLTIDEVTAEAYILYIAGFETNATAISFGVFEMARQPDVLRKLQDEVDTVMAKYDGKLSNEAFTEMTYVDKFLNEILRMHPPVPFLVRECTKPYQVTGHDVLLDVGTLVFAPIDSIHHDPKYFENPDVFDPERKELNKKSLSPAVLPFGSGRRNCIGKKFFKN